MTGRAIGKERLQRGRPPLDPLGDRKPLGDPGDDHGRPNAAREALELAVMGDEDQIVLGDEARSDGWVGEATLPQHDDVLAVVPGGDEPPMELEGEVLVEENPHEASLTAGGRWAARCAA